MYKLILLLALQASLLYSYPQMSKSGYNSCQSCHISPNGGGALNNYGRMTSAEILSMSGSESETRYFMPPMKWLNWGGDTRILNVTSENFRNKYHRHFLMQSDVEVAIEFMPGVYVDGSIGLYNYEMGDEKLHKLHYVQRRNFILFNVNDNVSVRFGRFFPAYGINEPDHTLPTKEGLGYGEGEETNNAEISYKNQYGEIFVTGMFGTDSSFETGSDQSLFVSTKRGAHGYAVRVASYVPGGLRIGASFARSLSIDRKTRSTVFGPFAIISFIPFLTTTAEYDQLLVTNQNRSHIWAFKETLTPFQGLNMNVIYEGIRSDYSAWRWQLAIFPRPHVDFMSEYQRKITDLGVKTEMWLFLLHFYL